ncbi:MAG TPA: ABC transporter permease subunit [Candidatus Thalassarchaeaceae archaeon]|nr:MAG TPA: ABC transporter permease subunit [Candidatus Poseidoniales archaeon]HII28507.1 ABC transporter permease subunit [Candidatus Thalassarchaeaceae archaeon]|tara:strand:- start:327 stop:2123 length:1797 start_codon:yes stop_codon:yes gene_type:complete
MDFKSLQNRANIFSSVKVLLAVVVLWAYNNKMLSPSIEAVSSMSRSFVVGGVQQNPAYYDPLSLSSVIIFIFLIFMMLARNEIVPAIRSKNFQITSISLTLSSLIISILVIALAVVGDFSPAKGMPFLLIGTPIVLASLLVVDDSDILPLKRLSRSNSRIINTVIVFSVFIGMAFNISFLPPIISSEISSFFSIILILMALSVYYQISSESGNPLTHDRRSSTMILIIGLPLIIYLSTRLLFLLHNPDSVTRERWDLSWSFMDMKNTFEINAWPIQPDFPEDTRWQFLFGAILNSARATLLSIILCTILGVIIGVTRLSSNKLASGLATVYVEVFRNMPLAVLLFLVMLQLGETLPLFSEEANIAGWIYYSNQGLFLPRPETLRIIIALAIVFSLWAGGRYRDRDGIDDSPEALTRKSLIWSMALVACLGILLTGDMSLPNYVKTNPNIPGTWTIEEGSAFEITKAFMALIIGLTLFTASVVAEIVRGSIQALPRGQVEAAVSLGLSPYQRLRLVILPQALRSMIPLLNSQYMNVWKNSSLAIIVAYSDIFYVIFVMMNNVGKLIPLFLLLLVIYQAGSLLISGIMNFYNARVTRVKI